LFIFHIDEHQFRVGIPLVHSIESRHLVILQFCSSIKMSARVATAVVALMASMAAANRNAVGQTPIMYVKR
jgi:hypothetical protein